MGFWSDVAVDAQNHIWILSRPHTLAHPRSTPPDLVSVPAPPVMEFDTDGNFIQAWGGESGPGYQWPSNEHGIHRQQELRLYLRERGGRIKQPCEYSEKQSNV